VKYYRPWNGEIRKTAMLVHIDFALYSSGDSGAHSGTAERGQSIDDGFDPPGLLNYVCHVKSRRDGISWEFMLDHPLKLQENMMATVTPVQMKPQEPP
jgi:hypothetical protein